MSKVISKVRVLTDTGRETRTKDQLLYILLLLLHPFNGLLSRITWVSQYRKGKTSLDLNEARDDGVWGCSDIS